MATPRLGAPELTEGQAAPETTVNEQVRYLESGVGHFVLEDRDLSAPPGSPVDGTSYLVAGTGTGGWSGHNGDIAYFLNTAWIFIDVTEGFTFWVKDENKFLVATSTSTFEEFETTAGTNPTESLIIPASDETTALTTGTAKVTFRMPYAFTLSAVRASVTTAPTGSTLIVDINEGGSTILSTKLSIDASEKTSTTAASAAVISDTALADDAEITIDIDQIGSTVAGAGLKVTLIGVRP
jgi:hypothetical protein